jgi:hypothetical protein
MLKDALAAAMLIATVFCAAPGQETQPSWAIKFADCLVADVFHGKPAAPTFDGSKLKNYRTVISEAARKGPNFAGHYTVAEWGCGSGCVSMAIVDAASGRVYEMPFGSLAMDNPNGSFHKGPIYQLKSRLFIADGCPNEEGKKCGTYYYEWKDDKFALLRFDAAPAGK